MWVNYRSVNVQIDDDNTGIFHVFELWIGMNEFDHRSFCHCLSSSEKDLKNSCLNGDSNPDFCDAVAVLYQLSYQGNWEQVVMWVNYRPIDVRKVMIIQEF